MQTNSELQKEKPIAEVSAVKTKIQEVLQKQAIAEAARINVWTNGGIVILSGTVRTFSERSEVEKAAWESPGVTDVKSELRVALFG